MSRGFKADATLLEFPRVVVCSLFTSLSWCMSSCQRWNVSVIWPTCLWGSCSCVWVNVNLPVILLGLWWHQVTTPIIRFLLGDLVSTYFVILLAVCSNVKNVILYHVFVIAANHCIMSWTYCDICWYYNGFLGFVFVCLSLCLFSCIYSFHAWHLSWL